MTGKIDLNSITNPLIDALTLPAKDVGEVNLKKLFQSHPDKLQQIVDLYVGWQDWGGMRTIRNWATSMIGWDERTALKRSPSPEFLLKVRSLLHEKIVEKFANKEALDYLKDLKYGREELAFAFAMLSQEDRNSEAFEQITDYHAKHVGPPSLDGIPRDIRGLKLRFLSLPSESGWGQIFDNFVTGLSVKVEWKQLKLFVIKFTTFAANEGAIDSRVLSFVNPLFGILRAQDMTEENLTHVLNFLGGQVEFNLYEDGLLERFSVIPEEKRAKILAITGPFVASFEVAQKQKMPVSIRAFMVHFVHLQMSLGTSEKDLMGSLCNLKEALITIDFDPDRLKLLSGLRYGVPPAEVDLKTVLYTVEQIKNKDLKA